jgi:hypothetical protein
MGGETSWQAAKRVYNVGVSKTNLGRLAALFLAILPSVGCGYTAAKKPAATDPEIAQLAQAYPADLAAAKKAGVRLTMAQLAKTPPPASENAAPIYLQLSQALQTRPLDGQDKVLDSMAGLRMPPPYAFPMTETALGDRADLVGLVHKAVSRTRCYFPKDWATPNPSSLTFPEMSGLHEAVRVLTAQSLSMANDWKPVDAVQNQALGFRIADHAATEPTVTGYLLCVSIDTETIVGLQKILYQSLGDPKVALAVQSAIAQDWHPRSLASAFAGQSAFQQGIVQYLRATGYTAFVQNWASSTMVEKVPEEWRAPGSQGWNEFLDANSAFMLEESTRLVTAADKPAPVARAAAESVGRDMQETSRLSHLIADFSLPVSVQLPDQKAQVEAMAYATEAGAAVLAWKASHGAYPANLAQAMSTVPKDPFDGKPIRYRREDAGFVIYSAGPWGTYDGGTPDKEPSQLDTAFRYPEPIYLMPAQQ